MSDSFTPNPMYAFGRVDTSAGEGGESLHKVNPALFGVDADGHIGRGAEVDGEASSEEISIAPSPTGTDPAAEDGAVEPQFAPPGGTVDTGPVGEPVELESDPDADGELIELEEGEPQDGEASPGEDDPADPEVEETADPEVEETQETADPEVEETADPEVEEGGDPEVEEGGGAPVDPGVDYSELLKADLIALADSRGIDSSGTKADIIERLQIADAG